MVGALMVENSFRSVVVGFPGFVNRERFHHFIFLKISSSRLPTPCKKTQGGYESFMPVRCV
jgi:hypothetical protein